MNGSRLASALRRLRQVLDENRYWTICSSTDEIRILLEGRRDEAFRLIWKRGQLLDRTRRTLLLTFLFGQRVSKDDIKNLIPNSTCSALVDAGLLEEAGSSFHMSTYSIAPWRGKYLIFPQIFFPGGPSTLYVGSDSLRLCEAAQYLSRGRKVFEIGAGTGLVGLIGTHGPYKASELDPRAAFVSTANFALNSETARCEVVLGDLYEGSSGSPIELLLANPPYLPEPDGLRLPRFAGGGSTGLETVQRITDGLNDRLGLGGQFVMVLRAFGSSNGAALERAVEPLTARHSVTIEYVSRRRLRTSDFLALAEGSNSTDPETWKTFKEHYAANGFFYQFDAIVLMSPAPRRMNVVRLYDAWEDETVPIRTTDHLPTGWEGTRGATAAEIFRLADGRLTLAQMAGEILRSENDLDATTDEVLSLCRGMEAEGLLRIG